MSRARAADSPESLSGPPPGGARDLGPPEEPRPQGQQGLAREVERPPAAVRERVGAEALNPLPHRRGEPARVLRGLAPAHLHEGGVGPLPHRLVRHPVLSPLLDVIVYLDLYLALL